MTKIPIKIWTLNKRFNRVNYKFNMIIKILLSKETKEKENKLFSSYLKILQIIHLQ
jgi:hypothetical protein